MLVNNAGVRADDLAISLTDSDWGRVIDTNLTGAFRATRRALKGMIRERFGRVINVASVVGPRANAGQSNYAAAKAGLIAMTKTVAVEVARRGVTVNAIAPGLIDTEMTADLGGELIGAVPARRAGSPRRWPRARASLHPREPPTSPARRCTSTEAWPPDDTVPSINSINR